MTKDKLDKKTFITYIPTISISATSIPAAGILIAGTPIIDIPASDILATNTLIGVAPALQFL